MKIETKQFIIDCVNQHRSDDLIRAKVAFRNLSSERMQEQYGRSGQTRQQILDGYEEREQQCNSAIAELKRLT